MHTGIDIEHVDTSGQETILVAYDDEGTELTAHIDWTHCQAWVEVDEDPF
jgi:hypothetical protein